MVTTDTCTALSPEVLGCVDIHVNGISVFRENSLSVIDFSDPALNLDAVKMATEALRSKGVSYYCPTITTSTIETYQKVLPVLAQAMKEPWGRAILGIGIEGPYFSVSCRGAHSESIVRESQRIDVRYIAELFKLAEGKISWITLSPALEGSIEAISQIKNDFGVVVSLGHHNATTEQLIEAFGAGATGITHFGNAWTRELKSAKDISTAVQFAWPDVYKMVIPDNKHVPINPIVSSLSICNPNHVIYVSDLSPLANAPVGTKKVVFRELEATVVERGGTKFTDPLSGSMLDLVECRELVRQANAVKEDVIIKATTINPISFLQPALERIGWSPE